MTPYHIKFELDPMIYFDDALFAVTWQGKRAENIPLLLWHNRLHSFPVQIAQWGLYKFNLGLKDTDEMERAVRVGEFLLETETEIDGLHFWDMGIERERYGLKPPWPSAMAQGEAISLLARLHSATGREEFRESALRAFCIMELPVEQDGVLNSFPDGSPALEEYPSEQPSLVLNGMIFAIFGVYDYVQLIDNEKADFLESLLQALSNNIHRYDWMFWSKYDLYKGGMVSSLIYHNLHFEQLRALAAIDTERSDIWLRYADSWEKKARSPVNLGFRNLRRFFEKMG